MQDISIIRSFIGKQWKSFAFGSCFVIITNLLHVYLPSFVGKAVDILHGNFSFILLYRICGLILLIEFVKGVSRFIMRYIIIGASWKIENDIRNRVFNHLLKLPAAYFNRTRTGDIIARVTNDLTAVRVMIGPAVMYLMNAVILLPLAIIFMLYKDIELTVYAVIPFPFIVVVMYWLGKRIHKNFIKVQELYSDISAHVQEDLNGVQVIKAFVREYSELNKLKQLSRKYVDNNRKVIQLQALMFPLMDVFASAGVIILLWFGGKKVIAGETTIGIIVSLIMYVGILVWPSIALGWVTAMFQKGMASTKRIQEILDEVPESQDDVDIPLLKGNISVRNMDFSYNGKFPVLKGISLEIKQGNMVSIVGRTGSGKSTLLGILSGIYSIGYGNVYYDGMDINDIPLSCIRSSIALTPQETFLFSDTIAENISFGREGANRDTIKRAAVLASIANEIELFPNGYESILGERGINVSGGQRQRIAIARSLISDAPIIFFDDSLSNVDTVTEKVILNNIKEIIKGKTSLIVTQRVGAIKGADEILYMKDGCITERGNHDSLMELDGEYAALYREQESIESLDNNI